MSFIQFHEGSEVVGVRRGHNIMRMLSYIKICLEVIANTCSSVLIFSYSRNIVERITAR